MRPKLRWRTRLVECPVVDGANRGWRNESWSWCPWRMSLGRVGRLMNGSCETQYGAVAPAPLVALPPLYPKAHNFSSFPYPDTSTPVLCLYQRKHFGSTFGSFKLEMEKGLGLWNMQERVRLVGGRFEIRSETQKKSGSRYGHGRELNLMSCGVNRRRSW